MKLSINAKNVFMVNLEREVPSLYPPPYCYPDLDLFSVVPSSTPRPRCANWSAFNRLAFLIVYVMFENRAAGFYRSIKTRGVAECF